MKLLKSDTASLPADRVRHPRQDGFLQRLLLLCVYPIIKQGRAGTLREDALTMPRDQACERAHAKFKAAWDEEQQRHRKGGQASLLRALRRAFGLEVAVAGVWKLCWSVLVILGAFYFVRSLIQHVSDPAVNQNMYNREPLRSQGVGWVLAVTFFLDSVAVGTALQRMGDSCVRTGIKIRAALMSEVYRKTFALASAHNEGAASVTSLVATDCSKVYDGVLHMHNVWTAPLETLAIIALLLSITRGIYGLPSLSILVVGLPLQYWMGLRIARLKLKTVEAADERVQGMQEVLLAIKLIKFYVWEDSFAEQVSEKRRKEVGLMARAAVIKSFNLSFVFAVPPVVFLLVSAAYVFGYQSMDAVYAFTVVSLFNTLRFPLVVLPKALRGTSEAVMAVGRLQHYLLLKEGATEGQSRDPQVFFSNAELVHKHSKDGFRLRVPYLLVRPGCVCAIVGRVSAGKSSLFQAILEQNMDLLQGDMAVGGSCSYVPQTPWVQDVQLAALLEVDHMTTLMMSALASWGGPFIDHQGNPLIMTHAPFSSSALTMSVISDHRGADREGGCAMGVRALLEPLNQPATASPAAAPSSAAGPSTQAAGSRDRELEVYTDLALHASKLHQKS